MPTVPRYERQFQDNRLERVVSMPKPDASVFGGSQQGLANLGSGLAGVGQQVAEEAIQAKKERNEANQLEKHMRYSDALQNFDFNHQQEKQGEAAMNSAQEYGEFADAAMSEILSEFATDQEREEFLKRTFQQTRAFKGAGMNRQIHGEIAWKEDTGNAFLGKTLETLKDPNTPPEMRRQLWEGYKTERARIQPNRGETAWLADEAKLRAASQEGMRQGGIALAQANPKAGLELAAQAEAPEEFKPYFKPDEWQSFRGELQRASEFGKVVARDKAYKAIVADYSNLPPNEAVNRIMKDPRAQTDPEIMRSAVGYFIWKADVQEKQRKYESGKVLEDAYKGIDDIYANGGTASDYNKLIRSAPIEHQPKLITYSNRVLNGDDLVSDPEAFDEALLRVADGEIFNVRAEYGEKLNLKELREVENKQLSGYLAREKVEFDQAAAEWLKDNRSSKLTSNKLYMQFKASIPEGGFKNPQERQKAMDAFWRKIVVDKNWRFEKEIRGFQAEEFAEKGYYPIRGDMHEELKAQIVARGGKGTDEEVAALFKQLYPTLSDGGK